MYQDQKETTKAQSVQVGFILALAILMGFASLMQIHFVPVEEQVVEIEHEHTVRNQIISFSEKLSNSNNIQEEQKYNLNLGTTYPGGFIFATPIPKQHGLDPQGTIRTKKFSNPINLDQTKTNPLTLESLDTKWNNDGSLTKYQQSYFEYEVNYEHIDDNYKYIYENTVLYVEGYDVEGEEQLNNVSYGVISDQNIINNNSINLYLLQGKFNVAGITPINLITQPVSTGGQPLLVDVEDGTTLKVPTKLPVEYWENMLSEENRVQQVNGNSHNDDNKTMEEYNLEIKLKEGTYRLQVAKIKLGTSIEKGLYSKSPAEYVYYTPNEGGLTGNNPIVIRGNVRDRYHNPTPGPDNNEKVRIQAETIGGNDPNGVFASSNKNAETVIEVDGTGSFSDRYYGDNEEVIIFDYEIPGN